MRIASIVVCVGSLACGGTKAPPPREAPKEEGKIGLLHEGADPLSVEDEGPIPTCAPLPAASRLDAGSTYGSKLRAASALVASAKFELAIPEATTKSERMAWVKKCLRDWLAWRRGALDGADTLFGDAYTLGASPDERGAAAIASAEAWMTFAESFMRVSQAAEPPEWRQDADLHGAYTQGVQETSRRVVLVRVRPALQRCAAPSSATDEQRRTCAAIDARARAMTGASIDR